MKVEFTIDQMNIVHVREYPDDTTDEQIRDEFIEWFEKTANENLEVATGSWEYI